MAATFSPVSSLLVSSATSSNPLRSRVAFVAARAKKHNNNNNNTRRFLAPRAEGGSSSSYGEKASYGVVPRHNVAIGGFNPTGGDASMDEARVVDPYGCVGDIMSSPVASLTPGLTVEDPVVQQFLQRHHGGPVVDATTGSVVGVVSRSDLHNLHGETGGRTVGDIMTAPPVCVRAKAHVAEAAGMMLQHRVHRLPVVDERNVPVGIATRSDIFEPLIAKQQDLLSNQEQRRDTVLHSNITSYPARDRASNFGTGRSKRMQKESSKFGTGMSWEEDEEKQKRMHKLVDEYNDEDDRWAIDSDIDGV